MKPFIICIVDDDDVYQFTITKSIQSQKLAKKILAFSDGEEALQFMIDNLAQADNIPDIIFLDINMPKMNGFEFMENFVKIKPNVGKPVEVFMVSSSVDPKDLERAKEISEISDYIVKPIYSEQIASIIEELEKEGKV